MPPISYKTYNRIDDPVQDYKYCISVIGIPNAEWFNSKLLLEEYTSMREAEENRILTRDILKLEDKNLLILVYKADQRWVKQCVLKG